MKEEITKLRALAKGKTVLYVEDEEAIRTPNERFLRKIFEHLDVACDGSEGLELYSQKQHDLVITDINMPNMNGLEMMGYIKSFNTEQSIVVTTAHNDKEYVQALDALDVHAYITKPFEYKAFVSTLLSCLEV